MGKTKSQVSLVDLDDMLDEYLPSSDKGDIEPHVREEGGENLPDGELLFSVQFDDAYHIRNLFEYLRVISIDANLIFSKNSIECSCANGIRTILNKFVIRTSDLPYYFNDVYKDVAVGVNLGSFARTTKNIGKKDAFKMFMIMGINKVFYEIIATTNSGMMTQSSGSIDVKVVDDMDVTFPTEFDQQPVQSIPINTFCHNCSVLANLRCTRVVITGYEHALKLEGIDNYDQIQNVQRFYPSKMHLIRSNVDDSVSVLINKNAVDADIGEQQQKVKVPMLTIKWISKLSNISPHGDRILIHAEPTKPIRLSGNIGYYGRFEIYLKNECTK